MSPEAGASATIERVVGEGHTAAAVGSGDMDVLATPQVLAWCEAATVAAVTPSLPPGDTTVGTAVRLDHVRATAVGSTVRIHATLTEVDGRRLTFDVAARDGEGEIASGQVVRVVVSRARFMERVSPR